jgi:tetratricopeptide (TPR) repeat protein
VTSVPLNYYESIGNRRAACESLGNLGVSLLEVGQLEEAETSMRQVLATAQKLGIKSSLGALQGQPTSSRTRDLLTRHAVGEQALTVTIAQNDRRFRGYAEGYLSVTEYLAADYARAEHYARAAVTTWEPVLSVRPFAIALLARALLAQDRRAEALVSARDAYAQLERLGVVDDGEATIRLALAECLIAVGDTTRGP